MDSLTQITLGAAMGEVALGHKAGNRAMVWGGLAGTLPDLDVLAQWWMPEIDALAAHRGLTHSLLFSVMAPLLFGWLTWQMDQRGWDRTPGARRVGRILVGGLLAGLTAGWIFWLTRLSGLAAILIFGIGAVILAYGFLRLRSGILRSPLPSVSPAANYGDWVRLYFLAFLTHALLDACTAYGTQLFYPFSDYRVSLNVISVVDPFYTVPFAILLIAASRLYRQDPLRILRTRAALIISTSYLLICTLHKGYVDHVFARSLEADGITATRFTTQSTPFNNLLWQGVAETDSAYFIGSYGLFDDQHRIADWRRWPKEVNLQELGEHDHVLRTLAWFSNGYYRITRHPEGGYRFSDLRFGTMPGGQPESEFVFTFALRKNGDGWMAEQMRPDPGDMKEAWNQLWQRAFGRSGM